MTPSGSTPMVSDILRRHSVRGGFALDPVPAQHLRAIVECGASAPSSKSAQPWRFHVVTSSELLSTVAEAMRTADGADSYVPFDPATGEVWPDWPSSVKESASVLCDAPAAVFIENRGSFSRGRDVLTEAIRAGRVRSLTAYTLEILGIGAAVENMWLAAQSLGLGAAFMGDVLIAEPTVKQELGVEGDLVGVLVVGYSTAADEPPHRPAPTDLVVWHRNADRTAFNSGVDRPTV